MKELDTVSKLTEVYSVLKGVLIALAAVKCMLIIKSQQDKDQPLANTLDKCKRVLIAAAIGILSTDFVQTFQKYWVRTSSTGKKFFDILINGMSLLLSDLKGTILLLDVALTTFYIVKNCLMAMGAGENKKEYYIKAGKNLGLGILILVVYELVGTILKYFK